MKNVRADNIRKDLTRRKEKRKYNSLIIVFMELSLTLLTGTF